MNIELIKWLDSALHPSGWDTLQDFDSGITRIESVGFVLKETDDYVALIANVGFETPTTPYQGTGIITIPKVCITERTLLGAKLKMVELLPRTYKGKKGELIEAIQYNLGTLGDLIDWVNSLKDNAITVENGQYKVKVTEYSWLDLNRTDYVCWLDSERIMLFVADTFEDYYKLNQ